MSNPQTEARAIAQDIVDAFHPMDDVPVHMIVDVAERIIATALTAKDAELAAANYAWRAMKDRAHAAEAHLAEVRKALEPFANAADYHAAFGDDRPVRCDGDILVGHLRAARRAREQGGQNG